MIETSMVYDSEYLYKVAAEAAIEGDNEKALEYLEKVLHTNPRHSMAWYIKGNCLDNLDKCEEALSSYDTAIDLDPDNCDTWFTKGLVLKKMGRKEESQRCMKTAVHLAVGG